MFSLTHKVAVVTGGASGIGEAVVQRFLKAGATVYSLDLVETVVEGATALVGDVSKEADMERLLSKAAAATGHIDILLSFFSFGRCGLHHGRDFTGGWRYHSGLGAL